MLDAMRIYGNIKESSVKLNIKAEYVNVVDVNNISVLVIFNIISTNVGEFEKGDTVTEISINDETGVWNKLMNYVFLKSERISMSHKHMKIELVKAIHVN